MEGVLSLYKMNAKFTSYCMKYSGEQMGDFYRQFESGDGCADSL